MMHVGMNEERTRSGVSGCIWSGSEQFHESRGLQYASNMLRSTSIFARFFFFLLSFFPSFFFLYYWNFIGISFTPEMEEDTIRFIDKPIENHDHLVQLLIK